MKRDRPAPVSHAPAPEARLTVTEPATIASHALFGEASEVRIDHAGVVYRLKRTAFGKLILTK